MRRRGRSCTARLAGVRAFRPRQCWDVCAMGSGSTRKARHTLMHALRGLTCSVEGACHGAAALGRRRGMLVPQEWPTCLVNGCRRQKGFERCSPKCGFEQCGGGEVSTSGPGGGARHWARGPVDEGVLWASRLHGSTRGVPAREPRGSGRPESRRRRPIAQNQGAPRRWSNARLRTRVWGGGVVQVRCKGVARGI